MNNLWTGLAVLFLSTALVACDGAGSGSSKGKGGGADSHQDDGKNDGGDDSDDGKDDGGDGKDDGGGDDSDGGDDKDDGGGEGGDGDGSGDGGDGDGSGGGDGSDGGGSDGGGGDGSGDGGGGDGGEGGSGGTTPTDRTNPLTKGKLPTERTAFYVGNLTGSEAVLTVDPKAGTFTYVFKPTKGDHNGLQEPIDGTIEGSYDPETGELTAKTCAVNFASTCDEVIEWGYLAGVPDADSIIGSGDDYVVLNQFVEEGYFGVSPTDADAMPSGGNVTYSGKFSADYGYYYDLGEIDEYYEGDATTRVNFDTGKLEVDFTNFTYDTDKEMSAQLRDVTIDGNRFYGGQGRASRPNGEMPEFEEVGTLTGQFFGPNGEELAGSFEWSGVWLQEPPEYVDSPEFEADEDEIYFDGSWIGVKQ